MQRNSRFVVRMATRVFGDIAPHVDQRKGLRLHSAVRRVRFGPSALLTSTAVVCPCLSAPSGSDKYGRVLCRNRAGFRVALSYCLSYHASWRDERSGRSHVTKTCPMRSTLRPPQRARRSAGGSPRPPPIASVSMPAVKASPSGSASTAHSLLRSPTDSLAPERCSADSRPARAPDERGHYDSGAPIAIDCNERRYGHSTPASSRSVSPRATL